MEYRLAPEDTGLPTTMVVRPDDWTTNPPTTDHDGFPAVIADARHAYKIETVEALEQFWLDSLERGGIEPHTREPFDEAIPYVNRGRWLVDCPGCNAGNYVWDRCHLSCCLDCGLLVKVAWQSPFVRSAAIRLLAVRPILNCNWNAHKGEQVSCSLPSGLLCGVCLSCENERELGPDQRSIEKNGLVVPLGLSVPDALAKYVDPEVA